MQSVRLPGALCTGGRGQSGAVRAGGATAGRAQLATQHCARHGRLAHEHCQIDKKKRCSPRRPYPGYARKSLNERSPKPSETIECRRLWTGARANSSAGWSWSGPRAALWPGYWYRAAAGRPQPGACDRPYPGATTALPLPHRPDKKPVRRSYRRATTGPGLGAMATPASSSRLIIRFANAVACSYAGLALLAKAFANTVVYSCADLAPLAKAWASTLLALKLSSMITILSFNRPPSLRPILRKNLRSTSATTPAGSTGAST